MVLQGNFVDKELEVVYHREYTEHQLIITHGCNMVLQIAFTCGLIGYQKAVAHDTGNHVD